MKRRAVFLDRDGTLNADAGYAHRYEQIAVFPESFEAVRKLNRAGLLAVVITNQSAVGRGLLTEEEIADIHARLGALFAGHSARLDGIYFCPHYSQSADLRYKEDCDCRKPKPGLALRAAEDLGIDLNGSYMIGDKTEDVLFARNIGAVPVLVLTGSGRESLSRLKETGLEPAHVAENILQAAEWVVNREKRQGHDPL
jgi:D-glycero-D-manno-heptose 1,7-bisphosphate phosphatase